MCTTNRKCSQVFSVVEAGPLDILHMSQYWAKVAAQALEDDSPRKQAEKKHFCSDCGRGFARKEHLKRHMRVHLPAEDRPPADKKYSCEYCDKRYADKSSLNVHVRIHTGETPYICRFCQRGFRDRKPLIQHERIHTGEKPFKCRFCQECFKQRGHMINHERLHTGEKPYKCQICDALFSSHAHLRNHKRSNHKLDNLSSKDTNSSLDKTDLDGIGYLNASKIERDKLADTSMLENLATQPDGNIHATPDGNIHATPDAHTTPDGNVHTMSDRDTDERVKSETQENNE